MAKSPQFTLNKADLLYTWERAKLFLIPLVLLYIPFIVVRIEVDGLQLSDFALNQFEQGALALYVLNRVTTAGQLYLQGKDKN